MLAVTLVLSGCAAKVDQAATATRVKAEQETATLKAQAEQAARNKEVLQKFITIFVSGKWDDLSQVIATDCVLHYPGGRNVVGLDAMKAGWAVFYGALKNMKGNALSEISVGDTLMTFLDFEATYEGEYLGKKISGAPVKYNQYDRFWMSEQLGFELKPK